MTAVDLPTLMRADVLDVTRIRPPRLLELMRAANAGHLTPHSAGMLWLLRHGTDDMAAPGLAVGVRGPVGAVSWFGETITEIPENGSNPEWVEYYLPSGHENSMPPGSELPIEQVLATVEQFARTGTRPHRDRVATGGLSLPACLTQQGSRYAVVVQSNTLPLST